MESLRPLKQKFTVAAIDNGVLISYYNKKEEEWKEKEKEK